MGRSITMYGFMIQECVVCREAILEHMMALLKTKAEYITLTGKLKEDTWLNVLFEGSGFELRFLVQQGLGESEKSPPAQFKFCSNE
ncbi:hypothetical protein Tco_1506179 [Tanacetum coccineum]